MPQVFYILFGAGFTVAVSLALGKLLLRGLRVRLYRQEEHALAFVTGAACLSLLIFLLCAAGVARAGVFFALGAAVLAVAIRRGAHLPVGEPFPPLPRPWKWAGGAIFCIFGVLYFFNAMAPETSPDGVTYHLGLVSRYLNAHGFTRITTNMYASLSQGVEMLFLFAFAFGRHSAAAMTHFAFLVTLPLAMLCYARRFGFPVAGVCAAALVFLSPVAGMDGTIAYNDVATASIVFTAFYMAQIWAANETNGSLLVPLGLVAGFGYAAKYTAFLAVPYVLAIVGWRSIRRGAPVLKPLLLVAGCATLMIAPWMIKNALWVDNPVSPFFNRIFPNRYVHVSFEQGYAQHMRHYGLKNDAEIPIEVTMRGGALNGMLGPMFLLAPLGLLALRWPAGRSLLLAALIFLIPYTANIGTRFLLPALPFVALAIGMAAAQSSVAPWILVLTHAILSWPSVMAVYVPPDCWRLEGIPLRRALRMEPEEATLNARAAGYAMARLIEKEVPPGGRVFTFSGAAEAYTTREILVAYQSAFGAVLGDILWTPLIPATQPNWLLRFRYAPRRLRQIRVAQTARGEPDQWSVSELHIFRGDAELPRAATWKLRASPEPWDVQLGFDNSSVTRWRSWRTLDPAMYLGVEFGSPEISDSVLIESAHDQYKIRLKLEGMDEDGNWISLAGAPEASDGPELNPFASRRASSAEFKARGVDYFLVADSDFGAEDFKSQTRLWGMTLLGERAGARLYRLD